MANNIKVSVLADVKDINSKLGNVEKQLAGFGKGISKAGSLLKGALIGGAALAGIGAIGAKFGEANQAVQEQQKLLAQTNAVLKSTGGAAGVTAKGVVDLSNAIESKSMLDAEAVQSGQNLLLTFTNIKNAAGKGNDVFNQTTQIMADMATAMGTDPKTSAIQLGKALNDPIKGVSALSKVGVSFTDSQKKVIKSLVDSGDTMGAQKVILAELNKEFGGSAEAAGKTAAGQFKHFRDTLDGVFESIVAKVLPTLSKVAGWLATNIPVAIDAVTPYIQKFAGYFKDNIVPALQQFGSFLTGTVIPALQSFGSFLQQNASWLTPIAVGIGAIVLAWKAYQTYLVIVGAVTKAYTAIQAALNVVMSANPIGILVLAIVGLIAALVYLWKTNDTFRNTVIAAWNAIKSAASSVFNWLKGFLSGVWSAIKTAFTRFTILGIVLSHWGQIKSFVTGAANAVKTTVSNAWNSVKSATSTAWNAVKNLINTVWNGIKSGVTSGINAVVSLVRGIHGRITGALSGAASWLVGIGKNVVQGLINGISSLAGAVTRALLNLLPAPLRKFAAQLGIHSPSTVFKGFGKNIVQGLVLGIKNNTGSVTRAAGSMAGAVTDGFQPPRLSLAGAGVAGGSVVQVTVNVPPTADKASIGREIQSALDEWTRVNGR